MDNKIYYVDEKTLQRIPKEVGEQFKDTQIYISGDILDLSAQLSYDVCDEKDNSLSKYGKQNKCLNCRLKG